MLFDLPTHNGTSYKLALAGEVKPSIEVASKIADVLNVSLDFLLGKVEEEVDRALVRRMLEVQQMDQDDKEHILYTDQAQLLCLCKYCG